ncbi:MAG: nucleotide sugar dehydrogenase [Gemmatimonadota bacterium]
MTVEERATSAAAQALRERIDSGATRVGVVGMGYVGLPLSLAFAERGFDVLGFDVDPAKVEALSRGESYIAHLDGGRVRAVVEAGRLVATGDFERLSEPDAILICVPTPLTAHREPDMQYIEQTTDQVRGRLRAGQLVVLESTTYPGTAEELLRPRLESGGLRCGHDFFLAFSPERENPGDAQHTTTTVPKVVGGVDPVSGDLAEALYRWIVPSTVRVSSARVAEATKLTENVFRAVNIALVNELKLIYERMGVDIWEVLAAADTKPFGFMRFDPGPGWGGHCQDGEEFVFVRRDGGIDAVRMKELAGDGARLRRIGEVEVRALREMEVLSFDLDRSEVCFRRATHVFRRWCGDRVTLRTSEGRTLTVTDGHPLIVRQRGELHVRRADSIEDARPILALGLPESGSLRSIDLIDALDLASGSKVRVKPRTGAWIDSWPSIRTVARRAGLEGKDLRRSNTLPLSAFLELESSGMVAFRREDLFLTTGNGAAQARVPCIIALDPEFARLIGYYLSEGCLSRDRSWRTRWVFGSHECELIDDLTGILTRMGLRWSMHRVKRWRAVQIKVSSNLFGIFLKDVLGCGVRSEEMSVPAIMLGASEEVRLNLLGALLNGDGSVYATQGRRVYRKGGRTYDHRLDTAEVSYFTSSPKLFQQVLLLMHSLELTPTIKRNSREMRLYGREQLRRIRPLLAGAKGAKLDTYLDRKVVSTPTRKTRRHSGFASVGAGSVRKREGGWVYSIEVPGTETYVTSYGLVSHNCIPIDPYYLSWKAREHGKSTRFIELAGEINTGMPEHVVARVIEALNARSRAVNGSRVLILGLAYKPDVSDDRESPSYHLMDRLRERGAEVAYHDPHVPVIQPSREHSDWAGTRSVDWDRQTISAFDVVVISTRHAAVDYRELAEWARCIVDTRNAMEGIDVAPGKLLKA